MSDHPDLQEFLDQFMGRFTRAGEGEIRIDPQESIAAVGVFFVKVGWILKLDPCRYLHIPTDADSPEQKRTDAESAGEHSLGAKIYEYRGKCS